MSLDSLPLVGSLGSGWFLIRALYLPLFFTSAVFAFQQLVTLRWLGVGFVVVAIIFTRQMWAVAKSPEPRFEVDSESIRCEFAALGTLTRIDGESVVKITVLTFRRSIALMSQSGRPMLIPWRWVRLQQRVAPVEFALWLSARLDVPVSVIRGPLVGVAKEHYLS